MLPKNSRAARILALSLKHTAAGPGIKSTGAKKRLKNKENEIKGQVHTQGHVAVKQRRDPLQGILNQLELEPPTQTHSAKRRLSFKSGNDKSTYLLFQNELCVVN